MRDHEVYADIRDILDRLDRASPTGKIASQIFQGLISGRLEYKTYWESLIYSANLLFGGPNGPDWELAGLNGLYVLGFDPDVEEEVQIVAVLPPSWKVGSIIKPQMHLINHNSGTGDVIWQIEWTIASTDGVFETPTVVNSITQTINQARHTHSTVIFPDIATSDCDFASAIIIRVSRDATNANDTYASSMGFLSFHMLIENDSVGCDKSLSKNDIEDIIL